MYRVRSTDVWYNAPGVVAAYQPVAAPDAWAARQNVGNDGRMAGRHTARPGVLPTHDPRTGWQWNGSTQFLATGVVPSTFASAVVGFTNAAPSVLKVLFGSLSTGAGVIAIVPNYASGSYWDNGGEKKVLTMYTSGVLGVSGASGYANGVRVVTELPGWSSPSTREIFLGAINSNGTASLFFAGSIQVFFASTVTLSPAHMAQYSRQMAYCHVNPNWSAWGRRRQYYYAPSAAGFQAAWAARQNRLIGGGSS